MDESLHTSALQNVTQAHVPPDEKQSPDSSSLSHSDECRQQSPGSRRLFMQRAARIRKQKRERAAREIAGEDPLMALDERNDQVEVEIFEEASEGNSQSIMDESRTDFAASRRRLSQNTTGMEFLGPNTQIVSFELSAQIDSSRSRGTDTNDPLALGGASDDVDNGDPMYVRPPKLSETHLSTSETHLRAAHLGLRGVVQALDTLTFTDSQAPEVTSKAVHLPSGHCHSLTSTLHWSRKRDETDAASGHVCVKAAFRVVSTTKQPMDRPTSQRRRYSWMSLFGGFIIVFSLAVASVFVITSVTARRVQEHPPHNCDFPSEDTAHGGETQPDIFEQCRCFDEVSLISTDTLVRYSLLRASIMRESDDIQMAEPDEVHACEPRNLALLALATTEYTLKLPSNDVRNRYLLTFLFLSWNGFDWEVKDGWLSDIPVCRWFGVSCGGRGEVIAIELDDNKLIGHLEPELGRFLDDDGEESLETISLRGNSLSGTIPSELVSVKSLRTLCVGDELLSDELLESFGDLTKPC